MWIGVFAGLGAGAFWGFSFCEKQRILLNDRIAKPGTEVNVGDIITLKFAAGEKRIKVLDVSEHVSKASSLDIYEEL